ncbi:hypothetical protein DSO57_1035530 [Entomophthora muscae]|uniref:Uncharacterized protein n=1 Tax=Entomophthora muscae TaxID=34485 RepID=A0ACC2RE86_9FUNG|nr:hypothetical protein DSO57_1035530 [Entomophthora muscae]
MINKNVISSPLKTQGMEQVSNPGHNCPWAASPEARGSASCPRFFGIKNPQTQSMNEKEVDVMIDNFLSLETWGQDRD